MTLPFVEFGSSARFKIAIRWIEDREPRDRRPADGGWSTGELCLTVGDYVVTRNRFNDTERDGMRWYLLPVFQWLATNWVALFHEERFAWNENGSGSAAVATFYTLKRLMTSNAEADEAKLTDAHGWWSRHALRASDSSALYPDIFIRRFMDDVEVSWTARQPAHSPDGFRLVLSPGSAILPVAQVAEPLWEALNWVVSTAPANLDERDRLSIQRLERLIAEARDTTTIQLESAYLPSPVMEKLLKARVGKNLADGSDRLSGVPALVTFDDYVLMFGGVSPDIGDDDVEALTTFVASKTGGTDSEELAAFVDIEIGAPSAAPFEEGYELADDVLESLGLPGNLESIDIFDILQKIGVSVEKRRLVTKSIRGVAVAGKGYSPAIMINLSSHYNRTAPGERFTAAHEFFHILYDRSRARRITHTSGPWAVVGVEKRANAFAAMLLMPRDLLRREIETVEPTKTTISDAAHRMKVGPGALIEHLYNMSMIDEIGRDAMRAEFRTSSAGN